MQVMQLERVCKMKRKNLIAMKLKLPKEYYVKHEGSLLVLRQTRFKEKLDAGKKEHPHDIMAYAHNEKEMQGMINTITSSR